MTVLITGATGMIGGALTRRLHGNNQRLRLAGRDPRRLAGWLGPSVEVVKLPEPDAPDKAFADLVSGARAVVNCAALNSDAREASEEHFIAANAVLPARIAQAAVAASVPQFIQMSSVRAVAGSGKAVLVDERTSPQPDCVYGRSKLEGEKRLEAAFGEKLGLTILRLAPVYGRPLGGNLALLCRLANTPLPLPLASLVSARSLLSLDGLIDAAAMLLDRSTPVDTRSFVVSDASPVTLPEIVAAMRAGMGRSPNLVSFPPQLLSLPLRALGRAGLWKNLTAGQVCDPSTLVAQGWHAPDDTLARLEALIADDA